MKPSTYILATVCLINSGLLYAAPCIGLKDAQKTAQTGVISNIVAALLNDSTKRADCGSLASVVHKVIERNKTGGRKLEQDKPLNVNEAQANLDSALRNPAVRSRVDQVQSEVQDPNLRLVYEAAIFDEEGYYGARELRVQQLQQLLK